MGASHAKCPRNVISGSIFTTFGHSEALPGRQRSLKRQKKTLSLKVLKTSLFPGFREGGGKNCPPKVLRTDFFCTFWPSGTPSLRPTMVLFLNPLW